MVHGIKILLVEDEPIIAMAEKAALEQYGYRVVHAISGEKALEVVRNDAAVQLVLMDIDLGSGMDGSETAQLILQQRELPIVFLSSHTDRQTVEKTQAITSFGYVVKNSGVTVLDASIRMAFRLNESERRFESLFEHMPDAFALHEVSFDHTGNPVDYRFIEVNDVFLKRVNLPREALVGQNARTLFPGTEDLWLDSLGRVAKTGVPETVGGFSSELKRHYRAHLYCPRIGYCAGVFTDVTEAREKEMESWRLAQVILHSADFIGLADLQTKAFFVNPAGKKMVGLRDDDEVRQTNILDYFLPEDHDYVEQTIIPAVMETGRWSGEFRLRHFRSGDAIPVYYDLFLTEDPETGEATNLTTITRDMTDQVRVNERFRMLFNRSNDAIIVHRLNSDGVPGRNVEVNDRACEMLQYSREEMLTMSPADVVPPDIAQEIPTHAAELAQAGRLTFETENLRRDGVAIPVEVSAYLFEESGSQFILSTVRDISDRKTAESRFRRKSSEYETIFNASQDALFLVAVNEDGSFRFLRNNRAHQILTGISEEQFRGKTPGEILGQRDAEAVEEKYRRCVETGSFLSYQETLTFPTGTRTWKTTLTPVPETGRVSYLVGSAVDITERVQLGRNQDLLVTAARELQQYTLDSVDYQRITDLIREISGAAYAVLNVVDPGGKDFSTVASSGTSRHLQRATEVLGVPLVGRHWPHNPVREERLSGAKTTIFSSIADLAKGGLSANLSTMVASIFDIGPVAVVRTMMNDHTQGDLTLLFRLGTTLTNIPAAELFADMVGMLLARMEIEAANRQLISHQETLLREVQHRIKNTMQTMSSLLNMQGSSVKDAQSRFKSMEVLYDQLYRSETHGSGTLDAYLQDLVVRIVALFPGGDALKVDTAGLGEGCELDAKRLTTVGLIVNELVTNAMKYAFPDPSRGTLSVGVTCQSEVISITVKDNGPGGLPAQATGFGLTVVHALATQLQGTAVVDDRDGVSWVVQFTR